MAWSWLFNPAGTYFKKGVELCLNSPHFSSRRGSYLNIRTTLNFFCTFTKINPSLTLSKSMCACVNACARAHALVERKLNIFRCLKSLEYIWTSSLCADSVSAHRAVLAGRKWWVQNYLQGAVLQVQISCNWSVCLSEGRLVYFLHSLTCS